jgi:hypothetical protein
VPEDAMPRRPESELDPLALPPVPLMVPDVELPLVLGELLMLPVLEPPLVLGMLLPEAEPLVLGELLMLPVVELPLVLGMELPLVLGELLMLPDVELPLPLVLGELLMLPVPVPLLVVPDVEPVPPEMLSPVVPPDALPLLIVPPLLDDELGIELLPPDALPDDIVPDPVVLEPGDAAGELAIVCASRLHASKSLCVGFAANAVLQTARTLAAVMTAVACLMLLIS